MSANEGLPVTAQKPRILIVDDEAPIRALLSEYLTQAGYEVEQAGNGADALERLDAAPFDLVMSDVRMPEMSGLELLSASVRRHPATGVVMLTACEDLALAVNAMRIGALDYILKPFRLAEIAVSVAEALRRKAHLVAQQERMIELENTVEERTAELRKMLEQLHDASEITLEALVAALDAREHETRAHSKRVSEYTLYLAREMEIDATMFDVIRRGAMLHDIGKIGIPDGILLKPGKLTQAEWVKMQEHPEIGFQMLNGIEALAPASEIVLAHHERWDGNGYPNQLKGTDIPLGARIFAVMDCLDVMTSDRPYRNALTYDKAREEIIRHSGSQFDPDVVTAFLRVTQATWGEIREETARQVKAHRRMVKPSIAAEVHRFADGG
jgi:putative two-component system response regulator